MQNTNQKVVSLSEFRKAREYVELKNIEQFVKSEQDALRDLDQDIADHLKDKRKLRETEKYRTVLAGINGRILELADWLEDAPTDSTTTNDKVTIERLRKTVGQLASRSEITRKVLVDDMANSRYYEQRWLLDPARIISLVFVGPVGIDTFIEKFINIANADKIGHRVGGSAVAVGLYLAFKKQADSLAGETYKQIKKAPKSIRAITMASALEVSVRTKPLNDIEPHYPAEHFSQKRGVIELKR